MDTHNVPVQSGRPGYPKMVYHRDTGAQKIVKSPDEWPEDFVSYDEYHHNTGSDATADAAAAAAIRAASEESSKQAAADAEAARQAAAQKEAEEAKIKADKEAKEAEAAKAEHREKLKAYLTEHNVEFAPNLATPKLEELAEQLTAHLKAEAAKGVEGGSNDAD